MAILGVYALTAALVAAGPVTLREVARPGKATRARVVMKAEGVLKPAAAEGAQAPKPLAVKVESRLIVDEVPLAIGADGSATRAARKVIQAASAVNGEIRPLASELRPEVAILVVERREGAARAFSPGGPLTRSELELVEGDGDPLLLAALLPARDVAVGDRWTVEAEAARALSGYDALATNRLEATLEAADDASATIHLKGEIRGAARGGEGGMKFDGTATFDRKAGRVSRLDLRRSEARRPGPVEAGLEIQSTLTVARDDAETPPELAEAALAGLPAMATPELLMLVYTPPGGVYTVRHDRDWHTFHDDTRQAVLKRLDRGEVVAQANFSVGPEAGRGKHLDPSTFREDLKRALGARFVDVAEEGELKGDAADGFRYRIAIRGREGEAGLIWYYYLLASPEGRQLVATFTLGQAQARAFGDQDLRLVGSLDWRPAEGAPGR